MVGQNSHNIVDFLVLTSLTLLTNMATYFTVTTDDIDMGHETSRKNDLTPTGAWLLS